ncbi:MAG: energy transducer TonB [Methylococcales bacterium]
MNNFSPVANFFNVENGTMPVSGIGSQGWVGAHQQCSWVALGLVLFAHVAVLAELRPQPKPLALETIPEPLMVSLVSAPRAAPEQKKASATVRQKPPATMKPKVIERKTTKNQFKRTPVINETPASKLLIAQPRTTVESAVRSVETKTSPVEAASPPDVPPATPQMNRSAPGPASDLAASFNAAYLHNPAPQYPAISRRLGEQGVVLLSVSVTAEGAAASVALHSSSGWSRLDQAALNCVKNWRFVPARRSGQAVNAAVIVPIRFSIEG